MTATSVPARDLSAGRRPVTLAVAVLAAAAVLIDLGFSDRGIAGALLAAVLVVLAAIDLDQRIIPNVIVLPATLGFLVLNIALSPEDALEYVIASIGAALFLALPLILVRGGLGMGDIKLGLMLGAALGATVIDALFYAACAGAVYALWLVLRHRGAAKGMTMAYGPFLAIGGIIAVFTGHHLGAS